MAKIFILLRSPQNAKSASMRLSTKKIQGFKFFPYISYGEAVEAQPFEVNELANLWLKPDQ